MCAVCIQDWYKCRHPKTGKVTKVSGNFVCEFASEENLKVLVANVGPIAVAVNSMLTSFAQYAGPGIYDDPQCNDMPVNHAVLVVGYGTENGQDYWLIKNRYRMSQSSVLVILLTSRKKQI